MRRKIINIREKERVYKANKYSSLLQCTENPICCQTDHGADHEVSQLDLYMCTSSIPSKASCLFLPLCMICRGSFGTTISGNLAITIDYNGLT